MILDTSALAAIFFGEPEAALYTRLIRDSDRCLMSAANFVELRRITSELADVDLALRTAEEQWLELEERAP